VTIVTRLRLPEGVLRAEVGGEEVLLNQQTGMYHLINRTGRSLLLRMEAGADLEGAIATLATESGEPRERVERDSLAFVAAMVQRGLLEEAPE
jgi:hypothetical protein